MFDLLSLLCDSVIAIEDGMVSYNRTQDSELFSIHQELYLAYVQLLKDYLEIEKEELL